MSVLAKILSRLPRDLVEAASNAQWRSPLFKRAFDMVADRFKNRDGNVARGVGKGLRLNVGRSHGGYLLGTTEPAVQSALATVLKTGMTYYDIGANVGFHSMIAAKLVDPARGNVICFEPVAENARCLIHNARLNGFDHVQVKQIALSDVDQEGRFWLSDEPTWGTLASVGEQPTRCIGSIMVPVRRLDDVIVQDGLPPPNVIKIDVEGAEVGVLRGGVNTIREHRPIMMIELHGTNGPIQELLGAMNYTSVVLGSRATIVDSPWDAYVVAAPAEEADLQPLLEKLRGESTGRR